MNVGKRAIIFALILSLIMICHPAGLTVWGATKTQTASKGTQATSFKNMTEKQVVEKMGAAFTNDQKKSGILASVSMAQFILESGYGKTKLAQNANNCFGMKRNLSENTWPNSTWDGKTVYTQNLTEYNEDGSSYVIESDFRSYPCVEDSIADHSAYLAGAKTDSGLRYKGLVGETDYRKAFQIIKDGGYATSPDYVDVLCEIVERWDLTRFDMDPEGIVKMYRMYNPNSGEHFYTARAAERDMLKRLGWNYEGVGWRAPEESDTPVYRLYNPNAGDHHYTTDKKERDMLVKKGWNDEGIGWYSADEDGAPVYRQYNPNAKTGTHNYTTNKKENDYLAHIGWKAEGIAWYGFA